MTVEPRRYESEHTEEEMAVRWAERRRRRLGAVRPKLLRLEK